MLPCHQSSSSNYFDHSSSQNQNETLVPQIKASETFVLRHFNHPFSSSLAEIQRAIHPPLTSPDSVALGHLTCEDQAYIRLDPPTLTFLGPKQKSRRLLVLEKTLNQSK